MVNSSSRKAALKGFGCLTLFALPFAAVGVGMTWWCTHIASRYSAMQTWVEVPATIRSTELKMSRGAKHSTTYQAVAVYSYKFDGQKFTGEKVGIDGGSDNIGHFQQDAYRELKQHLDKHQPFHCYVNPNKPSEAVLYRTLRGEMLAFYTLFATLFGSVGLGIMSASLVAARQIPKENASEVPDDQPWLAREDWAAGQIRESGGARVMMPVLAVVALYWNIASLPLLWKFPEIFQQPSMRMWEWVLLVFPAIGAALVGFVAYQFRRSRKFGDSVLQLASTPGVVGGQLAGVVHIPKLVTADEGFRLRLNCVVRTQGAKNSRQDTVVWQDERLVMEPMHDSATDQTAVPVLFAIPFGALESSQFVSTTGTFWRLDLSAKLPGVDYHSQFDVPVFKTAESRADFKLDPKLAADYAVSPDRDVLLGEAGLRKESLPDGGVRIVFPAARNWPTGVFVTLFLLVVCGIFYFIGLKALGVFVPVILGFFVLFFLWAALDIWFYRSVATADAHELTGRGGLFGLGRRQSLAADEVERFETTQYMSSGAKVWKNIAVVSRTGKKWTIGHGIAGELAQRAVIDELTAALHPTTNENNRK